LPALLLHRRVAAAPAATAIRAEAAPLAAMTASWWPFKALRDSRWAPAEVVCRPRQRTAPLLRAAPPPP
jgi:hypothetical protein